jgi:cytochrome c5
MRIALGLAFFASLLGLAACAPHTAPAAFPPASPPTQNSQPAPSPPPASPPPSNLPASGAQPESEQGAAILAKSCTVCHGADQVTSQHKSAAQWRDTVDQMIGMGAAISDPDSQVLVDYLAKNFGA